MPTELVDTLADLRDLIDPRRPFYNHRRIQRALGMVTRAASLATCQALPLLGLGALAYAAAPP
ncbi:MAG: hypothetical protein U0625_04500 [Phycisphaerales bacterium]